MVATLRSMPISDLVCSMLDSLRGDCRGSKPPSERRICKWAASDNHFTICGLLSLEQHCKQLLSGEADSRRQLRQHLTRSPRTAALLLLESLDSPTGQRGVLHFLLPSEEGFFEPPQSACCLLSDSAPKGNVACIQNKDCKQLGQHRQKKLRRHKLLSFD